MEDSNLPGTTFPDGLDDGCIAGDCDSTAMHAIVCERTETTVGVDQYGTPIHNGSDVLIDHNGSDVLIETLYTWVECAKCGHTYIEDGEPVGVDA